MGRLIASV